MSSEKKQNKVTKHPTLFFRLRRRPTQIIKRVGRGLSYDVGRHPVPVLGVEHAGKGETIDARLADGKDTI